MDHSTSNESSPFPEPDGIIRSIWVYQGGGGDPELDLVVILTQTSQPKVIGSYQLQVGW